MSTKKKTIKISRRFNRYYPQDPIGQERQDYIEKLKSEGVVLHVWRQKNLLLDHFLEYRLCQQHHIPYQVVFVDLSSNEEAERWIMDNHLRHHHLNKWIRAHWTIKLFQFYFERLAKDNLKLSQGKGHKGQRKSVNHFEKVDVNERLAQKAKVSRDSIIRVKFILNNKKYGPSDLFHKLENEEVSINAAYHMVMRNKKQSTKAERTSHRSSYINDMSKGIENNVICSDALDGIKKIPDGSLSLMFTSPPFCVGKVYADHVSDSKPWKEHIAYLTKVFEALKPKFRSGGRCVIEYQSIRTREIEDQDKEFVRPIPAVIINMMQTLGYQYRGITIWNKGHIGNRPQPMGSFGSPSCPVIRETHSYIFVFSVGEWTLPCISGDLSELPHKEYDLLTQSVWNVHTENKAVGSHVCPMPVELAEKVVRLWSYKGDLCADVFGGSGTLAVAALRNSRRFVLVDKSQTYCSDAQKRIQQEINKIKSMNPQDAA
jgi:DNA modification methylase